MVIQSEFLRGLDFWIQTDYFPDFPLKFSVGIVRFITHNLGCMFVKLGPLKNIEVYEAMMIAPNGSYLWQGSWQSNLFRVDKLFFTLNFFLIDRIEYGVPSSIAGGSLDEIQALVVSLHPGFFINSGIVFDQMSDSIL